MPQPKAPASASRCEHGPLKCQSCGRGECIRCNPWVLEGGQKTVDLETGQVVIADGHWRRQVEPTRVRYSMDGRTLCGPCRNRGGRRDGRVSW